MLAAPPEAPRHLWIPPAFAPSSAGEEAIELAAIAGLGLDPWQQLVLAGGLGGVKPDGKWAAFEVGVVVPRQNGKGSIIEARELAGLFVLEERLIVHTAHQFDTSLEAFYRLLQLIEQTPELDRRVLSVSKSHGTEGITIKGGRRIRFRTRTAGGGRGFTGDCLIYDEAMILPQASHGALLFTLSARPNPQVWYFGSAVDQRIHEHGLVLAGVRERGKAKSDHGLAYFEWSLPVESPDPKRDATPDDVDQAMAADRDGWARANPALGIRITADHIELERASLLADPRAFAVERLGVGDWPLLAAGRGVITLEQWSALINTTSTLQGPVCFAFDVTPDRSGSAIAAAGLSSASEKGKPALRHVEVVDHRRGTGWLVARLVELTTRHAYGGIVYDGAGPAASLAPELEQQGLTLTPVSAKEHAQACGLFYDGVKDAQLRHLGQGEMTIAIRGAITRPLGDAWAWSRKSSSTDISPLVACTLANWGASTMAAEREAFVLAW